MGGNLKSGFLSAAKIKRGREANEMMRIEDDEEKRKKENDADLRNSLLLQQFCYTRHLVASCFLIHINKVLLTITQKWSI